jgi:hypothetical protein
MILHQPGNRVASAPPNRISPYLCLDLVGEASPPENRKTSITLHIGATIGGELL